MRDFKDWSIRHKLLVPLTAIALLSAFVVGGVFLRAQIQIQEHSLPELEAIGALRSDALALVAAYQAAVIHGDEERRLRDVAMLETLVDAGFQKALREGEAEEIREDSLPEFAAIQGLRVALRDYLSELRKFILEPNPETREEIGELQEKIANLTASFVRIEEHEPEEREHGERLVELAAAFITIGASTLDTDARFAEMFDALEASAVSLPDILDDARDVSLEETTDVIEQAVALVLIVILATLALNWAVAGAVIGPLGALSRMVTRFGRGDRSARAEAASGASEARLRRAQEIARIGNFEWDEIEDLEIYSSGMIHDIYGVSLDEQPHTTDETLELVHPDDRERMRAAYAEALGSGKGYDFEYRIVRPDGEVSYVHEISTPEFNESGEHVRSVGTVQDITERKRAEEAIRTRDAWLRSILDSTPIQIALKDTEGKIMAISRSVADDLGLTSDDFIGRTTADFLPADIAEIYMAGDREVVKTGRIVQQEVAEERDGKTKHSLNTMFPLKDDAGGTIGICSMTIDMTELKDLEAQLRRAHRMEAVGQLAGGIAHDFNNLLQIIIGNAALLRIRVGENEAARFSIDEINAAVKSGAALMGRLLAFSRQQTLSPTAVDVTGLVGGLEDMLQRTLGETIDLRAEKSPNLWSAMIDPHQFENALINLAINARDAMPDGGRLGIKTGNVTLDEAPVKPDDEVKPGDYVMVAVSDTGTGISPENQEKIFEPFFTTKEVGKGSGLGLSMVYGFVKQSGGHISIDSEIGRGTTFKLYLPRFEKAAAKIDTKHETAESARGSERILIVEDDENVRRVPVITLRDQGYDVVEAGDGKEAIDQLKKGPPFDFLFTDIVLPGGMSGMAIAEEAKRLQPGIKVLFATGHAENAGVRLDKPDPGVKLLNKPYHPAKLLETVRNLLDGEGD